MTLHLPTWIVYAWLILSICNIGLYVMHAINGGVTRDVAFCVFAAVESAVLTTLLLVWIIN